MKSQAFSTYVKILALQLLVVAACLGVNSGCANKTSGDDTDARPGGHPNSSIDGHLKIPQVLAG